jgi:hypothetical protein
MYIQNRRDSSKSKGRRPHQNCSGLIGFSPQTPTLHILTVRAYCQNPQLFDISMIF